MTEPANPAAPAATGTPATTTTAAPAAAEATRPAAEEAPYAAARLERERRSVLKQLGLKAPKGVPAAQVIAEAKSKDESRKEKMRAEIQRANAAEAKAADLESKVAALKTYADLEMSALDDKQREIVKSIAGDDPSSQLQQIAALRTMVAAQRPAIAAAAPAAAPPSTAAAHTAQPPAPAPGSASSEIPGIERYRQTRTSAASAVGAGNSPFAGANGASLLFATLEHESEILANHKR